jgi:hypothetical protein
MESLRHLLEIGVELKRKAFAVFIASYSTNSFATITAQNPNPDFRVARGMQIQEENVFPWLMTKSIGTTPSGDLMKLSARASNIVIPSFLRRQP